MASPTAAQVQGVTVYKMHKPDEGIPVVRFVYPRLTSLWGALKRVDADVYYQRTAAVTTAWVAQFCRMNGRRSIYAGASDVDFIPGEQDIRYARDRKIFEWGVRRVDDMIVAERRAARELKEHYGREATLIPSCYVAAARAPPAGTQRLRPVGGHGAAQQAPRDAARDRAPAAQLPVRDDRRRRTRQREPEYAALDRRGREAPSPNIEMRGFVPFAEAEAHFDGARVFLNTSLYEGFPNTFLQAWARGIPTVGFVDTGSRRDGEPVYDYVRDVGEAALEARAPDAR